MVSKCGRTRSFLTGFQFRGDLSEGSLGGRLAQRQAGAQRSDGGGVTFHFVLAVHVFSTSRAANLDFGLRASDCGRYGSPDCRAAPDE